MLPGCCSAPPAEGRLRTGHWVSEDYYSQRASRGGHGAPALTAPAVSAGRRSREAGGGGRKECACAVGRLTRFCPNHCKQAEAGAGWEWGARGRPGAQRRRRPRRQRRETKEAAAAAAGGRAAAAAAAQVSGGRRSRRGPVPAGVLAPPRGVCQAAGRALAAGWRGGGVAAEAAAPARAAHSSARRPGLLGPGREGGSRALPRGPGLGWRRGTHAFT